MAEADKQKVLEWVAERIAKVTPIESLEVIDEPYVTRYERTMVPYRHTWERGQAAVVKFVDKQDEQDAFNMVASLLPEHLKLKPTTEQGGPEWVYLPAKFTSDDPYGQDGYVGWKWTKPLQPGEHIARARLHTPDANKLTFQDVVVTAETLPVLRASGKYAEIKTPKALRVEGE